MNTKDFHMIEALKRAWNWLARPAHYKKRHPDAASHLQHSMLVTARCRYNAAIRISTLSRLSFHTTTILTLGLIFIPLLQICNVALRYPNAILNAIQLFLAVSVLVYSVIMSAARYETRAEKLNDAGDRIKDLSRELMIAVESAAANGAILDLREFHNKYSDISRDSENHSRADYWMAALESREDYCYTRLHRVCLRLAAWIQNLLPYVIPASLLLFEVVCITDMLGMTEVIAPFIVVPQPHVP